MKEFIKVTGYKVDMQSSIAFLYTNNECVENELKYNTIYKLSKTSEIHRYKSNKTFTGFIC